MTDVGLCCFSLFFLGFIITIFWLTFRGGIISAKEKMFGAPGCTCKKCKPEENELGPVGTWMACPEHGKPLRYCKECMKHIKKDWREIGTVGPGWRI